MAQIRSIAKKAALGSMLLASVVAYDMYDLTDYVAEALGCRQYFQIVVPRRAKTVLRHLDDAVLPAFRDLIAQELPQESFSRQIIGLAARNSSDRCFALDLYDSLPAKVKRLYASEYAKELYDSSIRRIADLLEGDEDE